MLINIETNMKKYDPIQVDYQMLIRAGSTPAVKMNRGMHDFLFLFIFIL